MGATHDCTVCMLLITWLEAAHVEGRGTHLRYWPSHNEGDHLRGELFYQLRELAPTMGSVVEPGIPLGRGCYVEIVRNPTAAVTEQIRSRMVPGCACRFIVDVSAPFWPAPGWRIIWPEGAPDKERMRKMRDDVLSAASVADLITVPWMPYAEVLRERYGLPAWAVPDCPPDFDQGAFSQHELGWVAAINHTVMQPYFRKDSP